MIVIKLKLKLLGNSAHLHVGACLEGQHFNINKLLVIVKHVDW